MALKDALKTPPKSHTGYRSRIDEWRDGLDDADRKAFDAAVRDNAWTTSALVNVVNAEGLTISDGAFREWRKRTLREQS
ncbi:hypothetical protein LJR186_001211 [Microbacterium foliorum]